MSDQAETVTLEVTPQPIPVVPNTPVAEIPPAFSGLPGDFQRDLALLAAQQNPQPQFVVPETVQNPAPQEPEQPATAPATPEIADKFKNPDGTVNEDNLKKSLFNVEEAHNKYKELEASLRRSQNNVAALQRGAPVPAVPNVAPQAPQLSPLEISMAQDLINTAAQYGQTMPEWQAISQARVMAKGLEAKYNAEASRLEQIGHQLEDQDRRRELDGLAANDAWIVSPEGVKALSDIRINRPHVNQSPTPWTAAYREYLADQVMNQRLNGKVTPNPKGLTAQAPPTPVNPAPRVTVQPTGPDLSSKESIDAHLATLDDKGQEAFFKARGLRFR